MSVIKKGYKFKHDIGTWIAFLDDDGIINCFGYVISHLFPDFIKKFEHYYEINWIVNNSTFGPFVSTYWEYSSIAIIKNKFKMEKLNEQK